jgi:hypothetical protein
MMFDFGCPRFARIFYKVYGVLILLTVIWVLVVPEEEIIREPAPYSKTPPENFRTKIQKKYPRELKILSGNYSFDDPPEARHEADDNDDSDDPELYMDKYNGM